MSLLPQSPITVKVTNSGETTILPVLTASNQVYQIFKIQIVNNGKTRPVELKEGVIPRWRGDIPGKGDITADWGINGLRFQNNTPLIINVIGSANMDVNITSYAHLIVGSTL